MHSASARSKLRDKPGKHCDCLPFSGQNNALDRVDANVPVLIVQIVQHEKKKEIRCKLEENERDTGKSNYREGNEKLKRIERHNFNPETRTDGSISIAAAWMEKKNTQLLAWLARRSCENWQKPKDGSVSVKFAMPEKGTALGKWH